MKFINLFHTFENNLKLIKFLRTRIDYQESQLCIIPIQYVHFAIFEYRYTLDIRDSKITFFIF